MKLGLNVALLNGLIVEIHLCGLLSRTSDLIPTFRKIRKLMALFRIEPRFRIMY